MPACDAVIVLWICDGGMLFFGLRFAWWLLLFEGVFLFVVCLFWVVVSFVVGVLLVCLVVGGLGFVSWVLLGGLWLGLMFGLWCCVVMLAFGFFVSFLCGLVPVCGVVLVVCVCCCLVLVCCWLFGLVLFGVCFELGFRFGRLVGGLCSGCFFVSGY